MQFSEIVHIHNRYLTNIKLLIFVWNYCYLWRKFSKFRNPVRHSREWPTNQERSCYTPFHKKGYCSYTLYCLSKPHLICQDAIDTILIQKLQKWFGAFNYTKFDFNGQEVSNILSNKQLFLSNISTVKCKYKQIQPSNKINVRIQSIVWNNYAEHGSRNLFDFDNHW